MHAIDQAMGGLFGRQGERERDNADLREMLNAQARHNETLREIANNQARVVSTQAQVYSV